MPWKGNLAVFESSNISETREVAPTKIGVHALHIHTYMHEFLKPIPIWLNFLMTMDYSPCSEREIWPFMKLAISPKVQRSHPPKLVYMHYTSITYMHEFFEPIPIRLKFLMTMDYSPWSEREIWPFFESSNNLWNWRGHVLPKLVCMHLTSTPTCMNFLSQFQSIKFFDDHGL